MKAPSRITALASTAVVCLVASKLGDAMAFAGAEAAFVRPATGVALALLLLFGPDLWPGILVGAFLANSTSSEPALVAFAIAAGVTL